MSNTICSIDGCENSAKARSYCGTHWKRWRRYGDPTATPLFDYQKRFWENVSKTKSCWEWTASLSEGYGQFLIDYKHKLAHRLSYEWIKGPIQNGKNLHHLCRNRKCVNPDHLKQVTIRENILMSKSIAAENSQKTHCRNGHELSGNNVAIYGTRRQCRICYAQRDRKYKDERFTLREQNKKLIEEVERLTHRCEKAESQVVDLDGEVERLNIWASDSHVTDLEAENSRLREVFKNHLDTMTAINEHMGYPFTQILMEAREALGGGG